MYRYRIGKKCVKELQQNLFTAHGVKTVEHFCSDQIGWERLVQLPTVLHGLKFWHARAAILLWPSASLL